MAALGRIGRLRQLRSSLARALGPACVRLYSAQSPPPHLSPLSAAPSPAASIASPRKPSPYRLLQTHTFLSSFAPLHVAGWRLLPLHATDSDSSAGGGRATGPGMSDLQNRRLVRVYEFERTREGWASLTRCMRSLCDTAGETNHHPSISILPASEYDPEADFPELDGGTGYVILLSVHTHTPLPPVGQPKDAAEPMRPGVTLKDLQFATAAEAAISAQVGS